MRELRVATGLTQAQVAEATGSTLSNYQRIEHGLQNITLRTLARIADALGVEPKELFAPAVSLRAPRGRPRGTRPSGGILKVAEPTTRERGSRSR